MPSYPPANVFEPIVRDDSPAVGKSACYKNEVLSNHVSTFKLMSKRGWVVLAVAALTVVLGLALVELWSRNEVHEARKAYNEGRYKHARDSLRPLAEGAFRRDEATLLLGEAELALGRGDAAEAVWRRISPHSPWAGKAALRIARQALHRHQVNSAEELLRRALLEKGSEGIEAAQTLMLLCKLEGRFAEARLAIYRTEGVLSDPMDLVREHFRLVNEPYDSATFSAWIEKAAKAAPEDPRVRLAKANLAIGESRLAEAKAWLDSYSKAGAPDSPVRRAQLAWAMASGDFELALDQFLTLAPDAWVWTTDDLAAVETWFARQADDETAEEEALARLGGTCVGPIGTLDRRVELALKRSDRPRATALRAKKRELDLAYAEYPRLCLSPSAKQYVGRLVELAHTLGRSYEEACLRAIAAAPDEPAAIAAIAKLDAAAWTVSRSDYALSRRRIENLATKRRKLKNAEPANPSAPVPDFEDLAASSGLRFTFDNGKSSLRQLPETMSGGLGLFDYDNDGRLDVYLVQGGPFPPARSAAGASSDRLFRNQGDGTFRDVTAAAGLGGYRGYGHGVSIGDYDNDGDKDVLVTRYRSYALYENQGDGTFKDRTEAAGLAGDRDWPTSAAFADLDGDGDLDLYVCHYVKWDETNPRICKLHDGVRNNYCSPVLMEPMPDHLFRNDGGVFTDVSREAGIVDANGRGLGVLIADLDSDGRLDIFVANDMSENFYFHNEGSGLRFKESAAAAGLAANATGGYLAGMGIACGDLDGDGAIDLAVTNFYAQATTFYHNMGLGLFADHSDLIGIAAPTRYVLGFGIAFADFNNDGRLDVLQADGMVHDLGSNTPYEQPLRLLVGEPTGRLRDLTDRSGEPLRQPRIGRGLAVGDIDDDGRIDAVALSQNSPTAYLHNKSPSMGRRLSLKLRASQSHRDAVGAVATVTIGKRRSVAQVYAGGSYQSAGDDRIHFGLGDARRADELEIRWPKGGVSRFRDLAADQVYLIVEGKTSAEPWSAASGPRP